MTHSVVGSMLQTAFTVMLQPSTVLHVVDEHKGIIRFELQVSSMNKYLFILNLFSFATETFSWLKISSVSMDRVDYDRICN